MHHLHSEICCQLKEQQKLTAAGFVTPPDLSHCFQFFCCSRNLEWLPDTQLVPQLQALREGKSPLSELPSNETGGPPPKAPGGTTAEQPTRTKAQNLNTDPQCVGTSLAKKIQKAKFDKVVTKHSDPPTPAAGGERCLTWHLWPHCFSNCHQACSNHVLLQSAKIEALHKWSQNTFLEWGGQQRCLRPCATVPAPPHAVSVPTTTTAHTRQTLFAPAAVPLSAEKSTAEPKLKCMKHPEMVPADNKLGKTHVQFELVRKAMHTKITCLLHDTCLLLGPQP